MGVLCLAGVSKEGERKKIALKRFGAPYKVILKQFYTRDQKTMDEIGKLFSIDAATIHRDLHRFGVPTRRQGPGRKWM